MPAVTFDDITKRDLPLYKSHVSTQPITFEDMLPEERGKAFGKIEEFTTADRVIDKIKRTSNVVENALLGDVPFVRQLLPSHVRESEPQTSSEKVFVPIVKVARDIGVYSGAGKLLKPITNFGQVSGLAKTAAKTITEAVKGGVLGAVTAGSEDPVDIAKKAGIYGGLGAGTVVAVEAVSYAGSKVVGALEKSGNLSSIAEWLGVKLRENKANELVRNRYGEINSKLIDSEKYLDDLSKQITQKENKALAHLVESGNLDSLPAGNTKNIALSIRKYLDDAHEDMVKGYGRDVGFVENYIPHMWDIPKNKQKDVINWFITRNPHLKNRRVATIEDGIKKFGLKPKYENVTDILKAYDQIRIKSAANLKFVNDLKTLEVDGVKLIKRADKAPDDWMIIDHPAVRRAMQTGKTTSGSPILSKSPIKVHPSIYPDVKAVLDTYSPGKAARILDKTNTLIKQSVLNLSLFHHLALTETAFAAGMGRQAIKSWNPIRIIKSFKDGTYKTVLQQDTLAKAAVKDGLNIGAISDVEGGRALVNVLKNTEKVLRNGAVAFGIKAVIRKPLEFNNKFLWDYLHTSYKLNAYSKLKADMVKAFPNKPVETVGREVAQFVNDTFGGQPWEIMAKSNQWQQFSRFLLLSPDWVLSTMKQAVSPFGVGATSQTGKGIRKELGKDFWRRAIIYFGGSMNLLNYAYTKAHKGTGQFMWDNPPGKETYLFTGYNSDGTERYLRWGKQFRELAEAMNKPTEVAGRKISPLIRITKNQVWPSEMWQKEIVDNPFWSKAGIAARGKQLGKDVTPYSLSQTSRIGFNPLSFAMPVSRGMTPFRARKYFRSAILAKDKRLFTRTYRAALDNEIDPDPIFKQAISSIKSEKKFESKMDAKDIVIKFRSMERTEGLEYLNRLKLTGEMTPLIEKEIIKMLKEKGKAKNKKIHFEEIIKEK